MTISPAQKAAVTRRQKRDALWIKLEAYARTLEDTRTCDFDLQVVAVLREAAVAIKGKG